MPQSLSTSTDSPDGEARDGLIVTLALRSGPYDVEATVHAIQNVGGGWFPQNTYVGPFNGLALSNPGQVAVDSTGRVLVADTGNNRLVILTSAGVFSTSITGLTGILGVAVDSSGNIYVSYQNGSNYHIRKYSSALALQWTSIPGATAIRHLATDDTNVYAASASNFIIRVLCSTGASVGNVGSAGSGNGQFNSPYGIAVGGGEVYVVDSGNSRVQVFTPAGVYVRQWAIPANSRGIALDASGDVWVSVHGSDQLRRYSNTGTLQETLTQTDPDGIAVASGDVLWVANAGGGTIATWDEAASGYGELAIAINGDLSPYLGIGNRNGSVSNVHAAVVNDPVSIVVEVFGKATSGTAMFSSCVLSARAVPRR